MNKTKIEWTDYTWNPIKGLCPVACKLPGGREYCYARRIYKRFKWIPQLRFDQRALEEPCYLKKPSKIFVCSTYELFHPNVKPWYRDKIFEIIHYHPQHTFQILTKFPQNIDREMPPNVWLGVTVTKSSEMARWLRLLQIKAKIKFISFEPLLRNINPLPCSPDWIIVGRLTGHGKRYDPTKEQIEEMVHHYKAGGIPIFLKDNLKGIYEPLTQEMPQ